MMQELLVFHKILKKWSEMKKGVTRSTMVKLIQTVYKVGEQMKEKSNT